jgi:hypothetical protein
MWSAVGPATMLGPREVAHLLGDFTRPDQQPEHEATAIGNKMKMLAQPSERLLWCFILALFFRLPEDGDGTNENPACS